ncbi:hypothetical protein Gotur_013444 [Gossypium turneri]
MASGWGINGNKGRCYDFWVDFSACMSRCREPKDCGLLREDYLECLHHSKELYVTRMIRSMLYGRSESHRKQWENYHLLATALRLWSLKL